MILQIRPILLIKARLMAIIIWLTLIYNPFCTKDLTELIPNFVALYHTMVKDELMVCTIFRLLINFSTVFKPVYLVMLLFENETLKIFDLLFDFFFEFFALKVMFFN